MKYFVKSVGVTPEFFVQHVDMGTVMTYIGAAS